MKNKIMEDDYEPLGLTCCSMTSSSKFKSQLEKFKKACWECEQIEMHEGGFDIDDFPKLFAFVSFRTEIKASKVLDEYEIAMECRTCKDMWNILCCCCKQEFPAKFT